MTIGNRFLIFLILITGLLLVFIFITNNQQRPITKAATATAPAFVPGELIIKIKESALAQADNLQNLAIAANTIADQTKYQTPAAVINNILKTTPLAGGPAGYQTLPLPIGQPSGQPADQRVATAEAQKIESAIKRRGLDRLYKISLTDKQTDLQQLVATLSRHPDIEYVQPNYLNEVFLAPNDPFYSSAGSWGQSYADLWALKPDKINAEKAWDFNQGSSVVVAVIDTGIDYNHQDLAANIWNNPGEIPSNNIDDDSNGFIDDLRGWNFAANNNNPMDDNRHGTHVAGTIAAVMNNGVGVVGVAPQAIIMPVKGLNSAGSGTDAALAAALTYAASNGAQVINNSWGCGICPSKPVLEDAVRFAYDLGAIIIFSAGNYDDDVANRSPANMAETIAVAATDQNDQKTYFSSFGALVDLAAPGGGRLDESVAVSPASNILSLKSQAASVNSGLLVGANYFRNGGTSMAAPHVAAAAAVLLSRFPNDTNEQVRTKLKNGADNISSLNPGLENVLGAGRLNVFKALGISTAGSAPKFKPSVDSFKRIAVTSRLNFRLEVEGLNQNALTFSAQNLPDGATLNSQTGEFSWTPRSDQIGTFVITFIANDGNNAIQKDVTVECRGSQC